MTALDFKKLIVVCGHYGSGKTTFSLNLARNLSRSNKVTLIDMDIVNPYFRSSDYRGDLQAAGIHIISPNFAGTTLDTPSLSPEISAALMGGDDFVIIDAGGDDAGATALGCYKDIIKGSAYDMLYVINKNRIQTSSPQDAAVILSEIETASGLKATGVVANTHLCGETSAETILSAKDYNDEFCRISGLPLIFTCFPDFCGDIEEIKNPYRIEALVKAPW